MLRSISRLYRKEISSRGMGVFRILYAINLFFEVLRIYRFRELYFDPIPFVEPNTGHQSLFLVLWLIVLALLALGAFSRLMSIANYLLTVYFFGSIGSFEYHMDYIYLGVGFLMMFVPLARSYSLDRWILLQRNRRNENIVVPPQRVSALYYNLIFLVGVGFVYFGSVFFKFKSEMWMGGLGIWLPGSIPQATILDDQWLLNREYVMKFLSYLTLVFEVALPFIFFIKRFRALLFIIGVGLHIGILFQFPIPYFALGVVSIYVLLLPVSYWDRLARWFARRSNSEEIKKEITTTSVMRRKIDTPRTRWEVLAFKVLVVFLFLFQFNATFNFPFSDGIVSYVVSKSEASRKPIAKALQQKKRLMMFTKKYLGIGPHGVFVDGHFIGYDRLVSVSYDGKLLPMYDERGMPGHYLSGGSWADFNFRVNKPFVMRHKKNLKRGLIRYTAYWAHENNVDLENAAFEVVMKNIEATFEWEKDLLKRNQESPWYPIGYLRWESTQPSFELEKKYTVDGR
ncbi:MAG: HTTM domain-containing protein [Bacteroidota bacterium]